MNKEVFKTTRGKKVEAAKHKNEAGGVAYRDSDEAALATIATTGTLTQAFYASAEYQLDELEEVLEGCSPEYIAQCAVYAREVTFMKDMPAVLTAYLGVKGHKEQFLKAFDRVIDNGKMLRNFVQVVRSGVFGRKSLGSTMKRKVQEWLVNRHYDRLFKDSVGGSAKGLVSLADVIKMVHPKPKEDAQSALFSYIIGRDYEEEVLPDLVKHFEDFKAGKTKEVPPVEFRFLTGTEQPKEIWEQIAKDMPWHALRMNLNALQKRGVWSNYELAKDAAERLRDPETIRKIKVFPYQLLAAYVVASDVPHVLQEALQDAMEVSIENVPQFEGRTLVAVDTSGSMSAPVTGYRGSATSRVSCIMVASMFAAAIKRRNPDAEIVCVDTQLHKPRVNPRDSVATMTEKMGHWGGGTYLSLVLEDINKRDEEFDTIIFISDDMSWADYDYDYSGRRGTGKAAQWSKYLKRYPKAKMVNIDLISSRNSQMSDKSENVLNVAGFSDKIFTVIDEFIKGEYSPEFWVKKIKELEL